MSESYRNDVFAAAKTCAAFLKSALMADLTSFDATTRRRHFPPKLKGRRGAAGEQDDDQGGADHSDIPICAAANLRTAARCASVITPGATIPPPSDSLKYELNLPAEPRLCARGAAVGTLAT